jgi:putative peptide zinc metalloprotease protein
VYFVHGLGDSIRAAFYTPGALLVVFALVLAAAVFHEFGHASALRYGGGKVRGMGAGLYLLYPVLYSDVTDSYRLGRWGRVRTDLGGFYFHLVFALAMVGLSVITGQEFLLVLVLLINLTILSECLPFVRFDGYWALTDLTGIPDFFSQMGPFLASLLPARTALGTRLPPLKLWVKAVFVTYIVATVPVLAILYLVMVKGLPFVFVNTWDALIYQTELVTFAWSARDFVAITASASQMVFLALPLLASGYLFARVARSVLKLVWRWSKPTAPRRVVGALVTTGAIGLIASVWTPDLQQLSSRWAAPPPPTGVQTFAITERTHVETPVTYAQTPPLGGDHAPVWQNCGFYSVPIANENGVHSMEHGAVWVTYSPDLPADQVEVLRYLAHTERYVLVTPYSNLPSPIVASAWNRQLFLHDTDDPRLNQFIGAFQRGRQAPESGGPCIRGLGEPE